MIPELDLAKIGLLETAAGQLTSLGEQVQTTGADVHATFQQISTSYDAPETPTLANSTQPVKTQTEQFAGDVNRVGTALSDFATEIQPIAIRLQILKAELAADPENPQVIHDIEATTAQFHAAEQRTASAIEAASGWQTTLTNVPEADPLSDIAYGSLMVGIGLSGEALGTLLDGTGVGSVIGVPLNVASGFLIRRGVGLAAKGLIVQMSKQPSKDQPKTLSPEEQKALDDKNGGRPYDPKAYNRAIAKQRYNEKMTQQRNKQKRGGK